VIVVKALTSIIPETLNFFINQLMMKWLTLGATILTWPLIAFGAFVRLNGAGLSCPDWPLCYGQIIPPPGYAIALEVGHRFVATTLGIFIILTIIIAFKKKMSYSYKLLSVLSLIMVCLQGLLGGLTVLILLWPPIVMMHLLGGNVLLAMLVYLTWQAFNEDSVQKKNFQGVRSLLSGTSPRVKHLGGMLLLFWGVLLSGGLNSTTYSGYSCEAFPGCHEGSSFSISMNTFIDGVSETTSAVDPELSGVFLPSSENEWIHMMHRLIAILGGLFLMHLAAKLLRSKTGYGVVGIGVLILIPTEVLVGVSNAIFRVPVPVSALHTAIAATLTLLISSGFVKAVHENHEK